MTEDGKRWDAKKVSPDVVKPTERQENQALTEVSLGSQMIAEGRILRELPPAIHDVPVRRKS